MSKNYAPVEYSREDYQRLEEINKAMLAEIADSRMSRAQPRRVISSLGNRAEKSSPFKHFGEFLASVRKCHGGNPELDPLMKQWSVMGKALPSGMNETVGADGGFLVPPEFAQQILMRTYENDLLSRTTLFPLTTSNMIKIPAVNETSRADGSRFGGITAYWRSEAGDATLTKPSIQTVTLTVDSLTAALRSTQELQDDAGPALEMIFSTLVPMELSFKIGDALVNGDGVTKPEGVLNSPSKVTVAKETGQAAATLVTKNVSKMWSRLHPSCRANAVWLYDQSIEPELDGMTVGTAGAQMAAYLPPGGLSANPYATLKGRPMIPVEFCQQLGTEGDLILTDLATVVTATKGGAQVASSIHVYFLSNELVYRVVLRVDGKSWWRSSLVPRNAGAAQSNIVTLATRA